MAAKSTTARKPAKRSVAAKRASKKTTAKRAGAKAHNQEDDREEVHAEVPRKEDREADY